MRRTVVIGGAVVVAAFILAGIVLFALRNRRVLLSLNGNVRSEHSFQLLNPFREKREEAAALAFLSALKGACTEAVGAIEHDRQRASDTCTKERQYPLHGWSLRAIGNDGNRVLFRYAVKRRAQGDSYTGPMWIWVSIGNGEARVSGFESWY
jgi:hypothetical protein